MLKNLTFLMIISTFLVSCGDQKIDTTKAREEMEAREIKVVSDAQIIEQAMKLGNEVSNQLKLFSTENGFTFDLGNDTIYQKNYYLFDSSYNLRDKELQLFQAYNYNRKNGIKSEPNVQKLEEGKTLLYTTPIQHGDSVIGMWSIKFSRKEIVLSID